jgi:colanic acid biosynthesis glycosyl transferase WcaI
VFTAWLAARLAGAKLWIHVQDFEVAAAQATGLLPTNGPLARLAAAAERWLLRRGEQVSAISPQMCDRLIAMGMAAQRVLEVRNWADPSFASDAKGADALRTQWGLGRRKVALYAGAIARKQGIAILIEAARHLAQREDLVFVICGAGPGQAELQELAAALPNVQLHGLQPATRMGALLAMADLHLLPQIADAADLLLPSKLTNMLASGRPVVATAAPGTGLYTEIAGCGVATPPGDAQALAAAIAALADDAPRRTALGAAARQRAAERWHRDTIIDRVAAELVNLG